MFILAGREAVTQPFEVAAFMMVGSTLLSGVKHTEISCWSVICTVSYRLGKAGCERLGFKYRSAWLVPAYDDCFILGILLVPMMCWTLSMRAGRHVLWCSGLSPRFKVLFMPLVSQQFAH